MYGQSQVHLASHEGSGEAQGRVTGGEALTRPEVRPILVHEESLSTVLVR